MYIPCKQNKTKKHLIKYQKKVTVFLLVSGKPIVPELYPNRMVTKQFDWGFSRVLIGSESSHLSVTVP